MLGGVKWLGGPKYLSDVGEWVSVLQCPSSLRACGRTEVRQTLMRELISS